MYDVGCTIWEIPALTRELGERERDFKSRHHDGLRLSRFLVRISDDISQQLCSSVDELLSYAFALRAVLRAGQTDLQPPSVFAPSGQRIRAVHTHLQPSCVL